MLKDNIKNLRKEKGLSQEELAIKLNVVRQTVSKWERGLSVPDSSMLISLAEELDTSVNVLLGESVEEKTLNDDVDIKTIAERLEVINLQLARRSEMKIKLVRWILILLCIVIVAVFIAFEIMQSDYLEWDFNNPELAVAGTLLHGFEFVFVRIAPFAFIASVIGIVFTYKRRWLLVKNSPLRKVKFSKGFTILNLTFYIWIFIIIIKSNVLEMVQFASALYAKYIIIFVS